MKKSEGIDERVEGKTEGRDVGKSAVTQNFAITTPISCFVTDEQMA